jgi:hypothetical protein
MIKSVVKLRLVLMLFLAGGFAVAVSHNPSAVFAQSAAVEARVTSVGGKAAISGNGRSNARLTNGATLAPGDEIDTTGGGRVVIDLSDGSQVIVLPGSRVVVADYRNASSLRELLQITLGRIRVRINHFKGKPNPYRIKSPTASIAVRGTVFEVSVEPFGETRVIVIEGAVEVASLKDPTKKLVAEPKKGVIVRPNFTIDFFESDALTKEVGERGGENQSDAANRKNADDNGNSRSATNAYERTTESIIESGETALPSRFVAFPDAHLDSLENPAYAGAFTTAEGRINFLPSINGATNANDELRDRFGLRSPRPLDFSFVPEGTIFFPVKRFRSVVGGSFGYVRNGLQSLAVNDKSLLDAPPFPVGTTGLRTTTGATSGNLYSASLIFARRFGSRDQTSVGFSVERVFSLGNLNETVTQSGAGGLSLTEQIASRSSVNRTRLTFGIKHDFGSARFTAFYRYGASSGTDAERVRFLNGVPQPMDFIRTKGSSSEFGFRLRGAFSRRLFYGAEASLLFANTRENLRQGTIDNSTERARTPRATLGFGVGYILRPRTIFSFDVAGGLIGSNQRRTEDSTGGLLETERQRARFLSFHAAVQTDVWRNLFASASILSLTQSRRVDTAVFEGGIFSSGGRTRNVYTDFYSNYGIGWRFKPNYVFQYILTTDYGQTSPRHTFLLRYTFDFSGK